MGLSQLHRLRDAVTLRGEHAGFNPFDDLVIVITEPSADLHVSNLEELIAELRKSLPQDQIVTYSAGSDRTT